MEEQQLLDGKQIKTATAMQEGSVSNRRDNGPIPSALDFSMAHLGFSMQLLTSEVLFEYLAVASD